jgi:transaldolase
LPADGANAVAVLAEFTREGVYPEALAAQLQREGTAAFASSWNDLMYRIAEKTKLLTTAMQ